jgi:hypothetical protein
MHRSKHTCFSHAIDPIGSALSMFREAASNVPTGPTAAETNTSSQCYALNRITAAPNLIQNAPGLTAGRTTLSAYEHGQSAASRGKHLQACPFDTGTMQWRQWRDGFLAVTRPDEPGGPVKGSRSRPAFCAQLV